MRGGISVRAAGTIAHIDGTQVLFLGDDTEAAGILFLEEGTVRFPDFPELNVQAHEAWRLQTGQAPQRLELTGAELKHWRQLTAYNRDGVWRKPFWQRPSFYIPAAIAGGAGLLYLLTRNGDSGYDESMYDY